MPAWVNTANKLTIPVAQKNPIYMYKLGKINQTVTQRGTLNVYDCVNKGTYISSHAPEASEIQLDWTSVIVKLSTAQGN